MTKIQFVTFYADGGGARPAISGDLDGPAQIDLLVKSARKFHPEATFTVLSDDRTNLSSLPEEVHISRDKIDLSCVMLERMRLQQQFLDSEKFDSPVVFVDTDILVCGNLSDIFTADFDMAFTWRESNEMPINGGVIYVNSRAIDISRSLFKFVFDKYIELYSGSSSWYGDQFAILSLVNLPFPEIYKSPIINRLGGNISLLDCDRFNYSPNGDHPDLREFKKDVRIYHFKGMSRRIMRQFWEIHLRENGPSPIYKALLAIYYNFRFRLQRREYLRKLKGDAKRFNSNEQNDAIGVERAEIAAQLISQRWSEASSIIVSDVGCGDQKLRSLLLREGLRVAYQGFDLHPRSDEVRKFDIETDTLPPCNVAVMLGIFERIDAIAPPLARLSGVADTLILSYPTTNRRPASGASRGRASRRERHLPRTEVEAALSSSGFRILEMKLTSNQKTAVWLCESSRN